MRTIVESARLVGPYPRPVGAQWVIIGQDGGQSIDLGEATLFVFSDTLLTSTTDQSSSSARVHPPGSSDVPTFFLANSGAVATAPTFREALATMRFFEDQDGYPVEILVPTPAEAFAGLRFWPEHGCFVDGTVYLFYLGIETVDPGSVWGFRNRGVGLAVIDPATGATRRVRRDGDWRLWSTDADDFHLGVQVSCQDGWVYAFGSRRRGMDVEALVSRAPLERVSDPSSYMFLGDQGAWKPDVGSARSLGPSGSDFSVSFNEHLEAHLMVYVDSYSKELMLRVAEDICGPYSSPERIGRVPHEPASDLVYLAFEHPKFSEDLGTRLMVSYSQPYFKMNSMVELRLR